MSFRLIVGTDVIELFKGVKDLFPFGYRQNNSFTIALFIYQVSFVELDHRPSSR